jgi:hypothetical protein
MQVKIDDKELDRLYRNSIELECLMSMGVDNWEGFEAAMEMADELEKEEKEKLANAKE